MSTAGQMADTKAGMRAVRLVDLSAVQMVACSAGPTADKTVARWADKMAGNLAAYLVDLTAA